MAKRTSVYLEKKAESLIEALNFFMNPQNKTSLGERLIIFLSQIRFWDWEVESLLYSVNSFDERSKAWESTQSIEEHLRKEGILFRHGVLQRVEGDRRDNRWLTRIYGVQHDKVVAPEEIVKKLIATWNEILDRCEEKVLDPSSAEKAEKFGITNVKVDLSEFRRGEIVYER